MLLNQEKSIGESRVRTEFNPSKDGVVDQIKQKSAELINLLEAVKNDEASKTYEGTPEQLRQKSGEKFRLIALAQTAYEEAAMWAVKAATACIILLMCFLPVDAAGQSKMKYNRQLKRAERVQEKQAQNAPIVLDPIEQVPQKSTKRFDALAALNWGALLFVPDSINVRIYNECKYPATIYVFDTGGKWSHDWLTAGQLPGTSYTGESSVEDGNGHSTHCAGIIAGQKGADRTGWAAALVQRGLLKIKPVKILSDGGNGNFPWIDAAINGELPGMKAKIAAGEMAIVSGSFGGGTSLLPSTEAALKNATEAGVRFVFAAGNTGGPVNYPGKSPYSITCASLDQSLAVSDYSSRGPEIDFAKPGRSIYSTYKGNSFATLSGTSMATPALSATLAIAYSKWGPKFPKSIAEIERYLAWCATDVLPAGKDNPSGYGYTIIKKILDTDPTKIPSGYPGGGGGGNPTDPNPPNPDPGTPPTREVRTLSMDFAGTLPIVWSVSGSSAALENVEVGKWSVVKSALGEIYPVTFTPKNKAQAQNVLTVVAVEFDLTTNYYAPEAFTALKAGTEAFFKNRGLLLSNPSDYADAAYWTGFFLDMYLDREKKTSVVMKALIAKDEKGNTVKITKFRPWPLN